LPQCIFGRALRPLLLLRHFKIIGNALKLN
jgi:hypothetical protein